MSNAGHHHSFRRPIAAQLVSNNDARFAPSCPQQLAKEPDRGEPIPFRLYQDVQHNPVLIDCPPEVASDAVDLEEDFVQMPFVAGLGTPSPQTVGILFAELFAPAPYSFIADHDSASGYHFFYIAEANTETEVEPNTRGDDLFREPVTTVRIARHSFSISSAPVPST